MLGQSVTPVLKHSCGSRVRAWDGVVDELRIVRRNGSMNRDLGMAEAVDAVERLGHTCSRVDAREPVHASTPPYFTSLAAFGSCGWGGPRS